MADEWRDPERQPRCNICGRFAYKNTFEGEFIEWRLRCVVGNSHDGWEHE